MITKKVPSNIKRITLVIAVFIFIAVSYLGSMIINNKTDIVQTYDDIIYDNFSVKIDDIDLLINNKITGFVYFGRDTCPYCLNFNKTLKKEYEKNKDLLIYKFDTDFWRENENFKSVLDKYDIKSIPVLLKINSDNIYTKLDIESSIDVDF